jgi:RNA polymerase sigma-70 factor (ECF subfamily)
MARAVDVEELFEQADWILRLARRLVGDPAAAEDVAQQTMLAVLRGAPEIRRGLRPWIARVATNAALRRRRAEQRRALHERAAARRDPVVPSASELAEARDTLSVMVGELSELAEPLRSVVTMRYLRELSSTEIARQLGIPAGTVRWRLQEGLARLRARLDARFGSRHRWASCLVTVLGRGAAPAHSPPGARTMIATAPRLHFKAAENVSQ